MFWTRAILVEDNKVLGYLIEWSVLSGKKKEIFFCPDT